jgi:hypothetical protein
MAVPVIATAAKPITMYWTTSELSQRMTSVPNRMTLPVARGQQNHDRIDAEREPEENGRFQRGQDDQANGGQEHPG